ncbi:MAG TPA: hypothetical protein VGB24_09320 [Longimicrobium sp.]|uniref:hypothetical protein n=1 Tax=Longimicrobium sp. TaxID=2029185 RepID=UPI002EDA8F87
MTDSSGPPGGSNLPARRLSSSELEAVIRRAVEIQSATGAPDEGISEGEVLRIGQELGLDAVTVRRAIVDVRGRAPEEKGTLARVMGPGVVRAARTVRRPPAQVGLLLEEYLLACEYMVVQRRFPDRTRYVRATGVGATFGRAAQKFGSKHKMMELQQLDVAVSAIDDGTALVELSVDVTGTRAGLAGGAVVGGGGGGLAVDLHRDHVRRPLRPSRYPRRGGGGPGGARHLRRGARIDAGQAGGFPGPAGARRAEGARPWRRGRRRGRDHHRPAGVRHPHRPGGPGRSQVE